MPSRSRAATAAAFFAQGLVFISLTTRLPDFQDRWDLSELALSLLLLMLVLLAGAGSVVAERLARQRHSGLLLRGGLLLVAMTLPVIALAPTRPVFVLGLAGYGVALGVIDASSNMQAVALEHRYGRPILPSFHGAWTAGGITGAAITLATSGLPLGTVGGVAGRAAASSGSRRSWRVTTARSTRPSPTSRGARSFSSAWAWSSSTSSTRHVRRGARSISTTSSTRPRGWWRSRRSPTWSRASRSACPGTAWSDGTARSGCSGSARVVAFAGLFLVVFAPTWPVAVVGFTVTGAGVAVIAPLSFSAAARIAGGSQARVDAVIARFNQFNYVGALFGAVLTGVVGQDSLRYGFAVPLVLVLCMLPLARAFAATPVAAP